MFDPQGLHSLFDQEVPVDAQRGIVRAIEVAYAASVESCNRDYDERMRLQAWGYLRWLKVDSELLGVGERYGNVSRFELNTDQTHIGHTELHFGKIMLTAASVPIKGKKPKPAAYRDMLAESNQLSLFDERKVNKDQIWALILHVPDVAERSPLHIDVGFLSKDHSFAAPLIDLKAKVEAMEAPLIETGPTLRLRKRSKASG